MSSSGPGEGTSGLVRVGAAGTRSEAWLGRPSGGRWTPAADLFGVGLTRAVAEVAAARGAARAVAGALLFESYVMRVVPPVLAGWFADEQALACGSDDVVVEWSGGRVLGVAFAATAPRGGADRPSGPDPLMGTNLGPAIEAVHDGTGVGRRVLRGSVAHAASVAFLHLSWPRPDPAHELPRLRDVLDGLGVADLVHTESVAVGERRWLYAERRSCCLAFRAADHRDRGVRFCATCPAVPEARRRRSFEEAVAAFSRRHDPGPG